MPRGRTRRLLRIVTWGTAVAALAAVAVFLVLPLLTDKTDSPWMEEAGAESALRSASLVEASKYASGLFAAADSIYQATVALRIRTDARFPSFRDYRDLRIAFMTASQLADSARIAAMDNEERAREDAEANVSDAKTTLALAERSAIAIKKGRRHLNRARNLTHESEIHLRERRFDKASETAQAALVELDPVFDEVRDVTSRFVNGADVKLWLSWVDQTLAESRKSGGPAILVIKERNELVYYKAGRRVKTYEVDLGKNRLTHKVRQGDLATPEGRYKITVKKNRGQSKYHMALLLDYPTESDRRRLQEAIKKGKMPKNAKLGGLIEIHGDGGRGTDWTLGCVALSNPDIEELFPKVPVGTPVTIVGGVGEGGTFSRLARELQKR